MRLKNLLLTAILALCAASCTKEEPIEIEVQYKEGQLNRKTVSKLAGFGEEKASLLSKYNADEKTFIALSTDSAWALKPDERTTLKNIRNEVSKPDEKTLLQKVIPLEDVSIYMNNIYGGTVGGFVAEAADVKSIMTMHDVYWGFRLDYDGTKFSESGAGYAIIRFYSSTASRLKIPFVSELGGSQPHAWPNAGGGFTASTLGEGGYPEWVCDGYNAPEEGAELYEVTPQGRELLRSVYKDGKWQTFENPYYPTAETRNVGNNIHNGMFDGKFVTTYGNYEGFTFIVRGEINGMYHLTTTEYVPVAGLQVVERGVYGLQVAKDAVKNVHEVVVF